jgi:hypothetical protein
LHGVMLGALQAGGAEETAAIATQLSSALDISRKQAINDLRGWLGNEQLLPMAELQDVCTEARHVADFRAEERAQALQAVHDQVPFSISAAA